MRQSTKREDIIHYLLDNGVVDSTSLKRGVKMLDKEFYPVVKTLVIDGYVEKGKAFMGENLYVKQTYGLTKEGIEFAKKSERIQIQR